MREPKCPYFGKCGGCATQHIPYAVQLENKKKRLAHGIKFDEIQVFSGEEFWYRNRMDMAFNAKGIGFREKGSWQKFVDVKQCVISNKRLNELVTEVREFFEGVDNFNPKDHTGTYRYAVIRTPQNDSSISFVLNQDSAKTGEAVEKVKAFAGKTSAKHILVTYKPAKTDQSIGDDYIVIKGSDTLTETLLGKTFTYSIQGFFQNNHAMAEKMHEYVRNLLKTYCGSNSGSNGAGQRSNVKGQMPARRSQGVGGSNVKGHLLDLYAGVGTFGIINADLFKSVTIVESFAGCIEAAQVNIAKNNVKNVEAIVMDAKQLRKINLSKPLYVVTDPPRAGMHPKTIKQLNELRPERIIYISCNVKQLEKDLPKFLKNYELKSAALFDLFPQTNHMESVVELVKFSS